MSGYAKPAFMTWTLRGAVNVVRQHWVLCLFGLGWPSFIGIENKHFMGRPSTPPIFDLGFVATAWLHALLSSCPGLNNLLAALNTVFVASHVFCVAWAWLIEGRPRATISCLFTFTCRGILGYVTQLPLSEEYLSSGFDLPMGDASFFLFFSGHVAGAMIVSLDMRQMQRKKLACLFDVLNVLQAIRLLGTRGHYTIDLLVGVGAGILFDYFAGKYEEARIKTPTSPCNVKDTLLG